MPLGEIDRSCVMFKAVSKSCGDNVISQREFNKTHGMNMLTRRDFVLFLVEDRAQLSTFVSIKDNDESTQMNTIHRPGHTHQWY